MRTEHKLAHILRAIADGIPVQGYYRSAPEKGWQDIDTNLSFSVFLSGDVEYRIKPKPLIKKWRWVVIDLNGVLHVTKGHYSGGRDWDSKFGSGLELLQKIDSTMIEVEQDD